MPSSIGLYYSKIKPLPTSARRFNTRPRTRDQTCQTLWTNSDVTFIARESHHLADIVGGAHRIKWAVVWCYESRALDSCGNV